jgi:hypothetical protein
VGDLDMARAEPLAQDVQERDIVDEELVGPGLVVPELDDELPVDRPHDPGQGQWRQDVAPLHRTPHVRHGVLGHDLLHHGLNPSQSSPKPPLGIVGHA